mmetsp:Transcript_22779/g.62958  ORF Transcript_22779/g.62958 Transcript_22779/m.62958 type:complete len:92 (-) Transcript_22779:2407-2682(-)|eukprot:1141817-Pelagomonas_calceolata.AAC.3
MPSTASLTQESTTVKNKADMGTTVKITWGKHLSKKQNQHGDEGQPGRTLRLILSNCLQAGAQSSAPLLPATQQKEGLSLLASWLALRTRKN